MKTGRQLGAAALVDGTLLVRGQKELKALQVAR